MEALSIPRDFKISRKSNDILAFCRAALPSGHLLCNISSDMNRNFARIFTKDVFLEFVFLHFQILQKFVESREMTTFNFIVPALDVSFTAFIRKSLSELCTSRSLTRNRPPLI